jgi:hypothetical protein
MRRTEMMTAGGVTLAGLGVLAGLAIGSGEKAPKLIAQRSQPVEVRTEVIRKTINVYRRAKPHHVAAGSPGGAGRPGAYSGARGAVYSGAGATTRSSGAHAVVPSQSASPAVSTHTSGTRSTSSSGSGGGSVSKPVKTHTSGTKSSGGSSGGGAVAQPVKTHTSGTTSSGGVSGSAKPVATRSSGGGGHDD